MVNDEVEHLLTDRNIPFRGTTAIGKLGEEAHS